MRPRIGITADYDSARRADESVHFATDELVSAVASAGGLPLLIPSMGETVFEAVLRAVDGLLFSGSGADLDPRHYGEAPHPALGRQNPRRLDSELQLARLALAGELPLLGICGGMQTLVVASGGTLYQDIASQRPEALQHKPDIPSSQPAHAVTIEAGSRLEKIVSTGRLEVNSTHHQAANMVAGPLVVRAAADDGVVEAVEAPGERFILGLQWHPEYLAPKDEASRAIFEAFVAAARAHAGV